MTMIKRLLSIGALLALAACGGGGGGAGTPGFGGNPGGGNGGANAGAVADLTVTLSSPTIANTGQSTVTATVTALDANRNALPNVPVTVSADANAVVTVQGTAGSVTDASGRIQAQVGIGSDSTNRDITVSASANGVTRSAILRVVTSTGGATATAIEVLAGATSVGTGGEGVQVRAFVKDAANNALSGVPVTFVASTGTLTNVSATTDASGVATATFNAGADKSNRVATVTVSSGAVTSTLSLPVAGTRLTLSGPSSLIRNATAAFDIVVTDSRNNVVAGVPVTVSSSLGNPVVPVGANTTDANGQVRFNYTARNPGTDALVFSAAGASVAPSPALVISGQNFAFISPVPSTTVAVNTAQPVRVRLEGVTPLAGNVINFAATGGTLSSPSATTDASGEATVSVSSSSAGPITVQATVAGTATTTTLPLLVVSTVPSRLVLQVTPTALAPNTGGSTANQAQVVARVTDAAGNPVQGITVNFTRLTDPSGGNLLQASATTDASGQATVAYRAGSESTANNGVVLRAAVADSPGVAGTVSLTVNQTSLFIALGTGNVIENLDPQTYKKDWVVYVTDSNGIPVNGATLTIKAIPAAYRTGRLAWNGTVWAYAGTIYSCRNEDANTNGVRDPGEDDNGDGVLWPGNVISVTPGTVQTVNGRATVSLIYAESYAPWVDMRLTASATVSGTESQTEVRFVVSGLASDFNSESVPPAGVVSPFNLRPTDAALATPGACTQVQ